MTSEIKVASRQKCRAFKYYCRRGRNETDKTQLDRVAEECSNLVTVSRENYFKRLGNKLNDPLLAPKAYWSILNRFLGKKKFH